MIRATELMPGDIVQHHGEILKLYEFSRKYAYFGEGHPLNGILISEIEPFPLTPEILEKNGFKKSESDTLSQTWAWAEKSEKIYNRWVQVTFYNEPINGVSYLTKIETCSSKGDGVNRLHSCDIESVHELQHALRLCKIEKEIEL